MYGDIHFRIFFHLLNSLREKPGLYNTYMTFMGFTLDAHLACARLSLMKLYDRTKKATNIERLHQYAKDSLSKDIQNEVIKDISYPLLKKTVSNCESLLGQLDNLPCVLKKQRNKHFIHLSEEYAGDYNKVYDAFRITMDDLRRLYGITIEFLEEYQYMLPGPSASLAVLGIEPAIEDSLIKMERCAKSENGPEQLYYERFKLADLE
jgi:AbiU2